MIVSTEHLALDATYQDISADTIAQKAEQWLPEDFAELCQQLVKGEFRNATENRVVSHCLSRSLNSVVAAGNGNNRFSEIVRELRSGRWLGATGKPITDVVNIGVGGSDLGPMMASFALREFADDASRHHLNVHFVSSMDGGQLYAVLPIIDPETTLFIIASKSFTTVDTMANVETVRRWVEPSLSDEQWLSRHVIGVSASAQKMTDYGIPPKQQLTFADSVGGRFSVWSAIGLPIALTTGVRVFERMLAGAKSVDEHFVNAPLVENIPVLMALYGVYNRQERGINNLAILPYDGRFRYLPNYLQQLDMESNGKLANYRNELVDYATGPIVWGGFGPNGQHAFFQHLHQGYDSFTADFLVVLSRDAKQFGISVQEGLAKQQRLSVANCLAHRSLMYYGHDNADKSPRDHYNGGHPSNLLVIDELTPESFGAVVATYEHKVFTQGVIWEINSFDQPGVERGKQLAMDMLDVLDNDSTQTFDASTNNIINRLKEL